MFSLTEIVHMPFLTNHCRWLPLGGSQAIGLMAILSLIFVRSIAIYLLDWIVPECHCQPFANGIGGTAGGKRGQHSQVTAVIVKWLSRRTILPILNGHLQQTRRLNGCGSGFPCLENLSRNVWYMKRSHPQVIIYYTQCQRYPVRCPSTIFDQGLKTCSMLLSQRSQFLNSVRAAAVK